MADDIAQHRIAIDALDQQIVALLNERAGHAQAIGHIKGASVVYRPERESEVLQNAVRGNRGPLRPESVANVFVAIMSACRALERPLSIAFLGPAGTFSEMALLRHFGKEVLTVSCSSIDEVFRQAETNSVHYAIVPVENSTEGSIGRTLDLLLQTPLKICAEVMQRVRQNLMSRENALSGITRVYSHAQSLGQCQGWLAGHLPSAERVPVFSNAEAARLASAEPGAAAIAGELAAERYDLRILAANIEDDQKNTTRFLVLGNQDTRPSGKDRTSLVMSAPNRPGAVHALVAPFAKAGISMRKIESRPARTGTWEYLFYVDLDGHQEDAAVAASLDELRTLAPFLKVFGSYPAAIG
ncbi:MAG: prephenate dehydratase [Betaproteobacteria bacterium]|nr:prephenate dehydratase [Betaproteobacteria bacterium]